MGDMSRFTGVLRREDLPSCVFCIHKHSGAATCAAFPRGIPEEILRGEVRHTEPYPGDGGIQFEPDD